MKKIIGHLVRREQVITLVEQGTLRGLPTSRLRRGITLPAAYHDLDWGYIEVVQAHDTTLILFHYDRGTYDAAGNILDYDEWAYTTSPVDLTVHDTSGRPGVESAVAHACPDAALPGRVVQIQPHWFWLTCARELVVGS